MPFVGRIGGLGSEDGIPARGGGRGDRCDSTLPCDKLDSAACGFLPWGTLAVNLVGSLLIGMLLEMTLRGYLSGQARLLIAVGLLGGFTTFSSLSWETLMLLEEGDMIPALLNAFGSLLAGVMLAWLGSVLVRWML